MDFSDEKGVENKQAQGLSEEKRFFFLCVFFDLQFNRTLLTSG